MHRKEMEQVRACYARSRLLDKSPAFAERPINKEASARHIFFRHRTKVSAIARKITIVTECKVAPIRNCKCFVRCREILELVHIRITAVSVLAIHYTLEHPFGRFASIYEQ